MTPRVDRPSSTFFTTTIVARGAGLAGAWADRLSPPRSSVANRDRYNPVFDRTRTVLTASRWPPGDVAQTTGGDHYIMEDVPPR